MKSLIRNINNKRHFYLEYITIIILFFLSRIIYINFFKIEFDFWTLKYYWQFFPEDLLKNDLLQSLIYNPYQPPLLNLIVGIFHKITSNYLQYLKLFFYTISLINFIFFYKILKTFSLNSKINLAITCILMILPTTILYENHLYKDHLVMCFLTILVYYSLKIAKKKQIISYLIFSFFLTLIVLLRETFHIYWALLFIIFLFYINKEFKKNLICLIFLVIFVFPFYLKNYFLYEKFAINLSTFESLSQKLEFVKEIKNNSKHKELKKFFFKSDNNFNELFSSMSKIYEVPLNSDPDTYSAILKYDYKYQNSLLRSKSYFNEVYLAVEPLREKDFRTIVNNYPGLLLISISNAGLRHFFRSSDTFYFTRFNADKIPHLIRFSHCLKLTLTCVYEFPFEKQKFELDGKSFLKINYDNLDYLQKLKFSINDTNFILVFIYLYVLFQIFKYFFICKKKIKFEKEIKIINFWVLTFLFIFTILIIFEDGELPRHRYPFDYLMFVFAFFYYSYNKIQNKSDA
jgi:hypothetical protein